MKNQGASFGGWKYSRLMQDEDGAQNDGIHVVGIEGDENAGVVDLGLGADEQFEEAVLSSSFLGEEISERNGGLMIVALVSHDRGLVGDDDDFEEAPFYVIPYGIGVKRSGDPQGCQTRWNFLIAQ